MDSPLKDNLFRSFARLGPMPGWAALDRPGFQALRTSIAAPIHNLAWGTPTPGNLGLAAAFFGSLPHRWFLDPGEDPGLLEAAGYRVGEPTREMILDLAGLAVPGPPPDVEILPASPADWDEAFRIAGEAFGTGAPAEAAAQAPFLRGAGHVVFLARVAGRPAATALVSPGEGTGGVHNVATLPAFRGRGLGSAVTWACLAQAKAWGLERLALYGSRMGVPVYERMGFRTVAIRAECLSA